MPCHLNLQVLPTVEGVGDPAGAGAGLHPGRRATLGRLVGAAEPGLAAGRRPRADPRLRPRTRPPQAHRRLRGEGDQELARGEPRLRQV